MRIGTYTLVGRFVQQPGEEIRRLIRYTDWLEEGETIQTVAASIDNATTPPLVVDTLLIDPDGDRIAFNASGGVDGEEYTVTFTITTSAGQTREDEVQIYVKEVRRG